MLKIRLQRVGRKNDPSFRVVVTDSKNGPKSGAFVEILGSYNARMGDPQLKSDRIKHWISVGAQVSDTVHNLLIDAKIIEGKKIDVTPPQKKKGEEAAKAETPKEGVSAEVQTAEVKDSTTEEASQAEEVAPPAPTVETSESTPKPTAETKEEPAPEPDPEIKPEETPKEEQAAPEPVA